MGLKGDIEEVRLSWSKSPWWVRAWLCLSAYLAISAIASLSETIVKWKGFFHDFVEFYRTWISLPLADVLRGININIVGSNIDLVLGFCMMIPCSIISLMFGTEDVAVKQPDNKAFLTATIAVIMFSVFFIVECVFEYSDQPALGSKDYIMMSCGLLFLPFIMLIHPTTRKDIKRHCYLYYGPTVIIVCAIALLAAINKGLSG